MSRAVIIFTPAEASKTCLPWIVDYETDAEMNRKAHKLISNKLGLPDGLVVFADNTAEETDVSYHRPCGETQLMGRVRFVNGGEPMPGNFHIRYVQITNVVGATAKYEVHFPSGHVETLELQPDVAEHCANRAGTIIEQQIAA